MLWLLMLACGANREPLPHVLAPPPSTPNCVHSKAPPSDEVHAIAPIAAPNPEEDWARLHRVVMAMPRVRLVAESTDYRQYVFTTALMRFKDDVQFQLDRDARLIHFRSASRIGQSDLGVNRRRMEQIRAAMRE